MKNLNRDFTKNEKIILLVLALALLALAYYHFVDQVVRQEIAAAEAERDSLQMDLLQLQTQLAELTRMQRELTDLGGHISYMPSYSNRSAEMTLLNHILGSANEYAISFSGLTRSGDLIRRAIALQFTTPNFHTAREILVQLVTSEYRCLLGDITYNATPTGQVSISVSCTFYETMVGGEADSLLPADTSAG